MPSKPEALLMAAVILLLAGLAPGLHAQEPADKQWRAVAPGRIEPKSGEIRIAAPLTGRIGEVLVRANDKVFAGEALIRLEDAEARARLAQAEAQIAFRERLRNDQSPSSRAGERRKAEDAVAEAEAAVIEAQAALDKAAAVRRGGSAGAADLEKARATLTAARAGLAERRAELRRITSDAPLPTQSEGQLAIARADLDVARAAIEKLVVRAPLAGTVLQVNARLGELASPAASQPLVIMGDTSALRVRAEVDERDFTQIKLGQPAVIRAGAFAGRDFAGKVAAIAPLVEPSSISARGLRSMTDVNVVEVLVDVADPGPLTVGMKVDVYFRAEGS